MKKWITGFVLGWIIGALGAFLVFELKQVWGWPIMAVGDVVWLYSIYRIVMKRLQSS